MLGTAAGPVVWRGRTGISTVISVEGVNYMVDAGIGSMQRYRQSGFQWEDLRHIFITHMHSDHYLELPHAILIPWELPGESYTDTLHIWGPGSVAMDLPHFAPPGQPAYPIRVENVASPIPGITEVVHGIIGNSFQGLVLQPRIEAEVAFVLGADLTEGPLDAAQVREATEYVAAALEVCGSRIENWDISFADTVADNASAGAFVLGPQRRTLAEVNPVEVEMSMTIDAEQVSTGTGAACLGDPVQAVVWLARTAVELGQPLRAGDVVLSGALGPMRPVVAGDVVTATLTGLGAVTVTISEGADS